MKKASTCASFALGMLAVAATAAYADETTFCNAYITTLPYTISVQGHYCLNRNLSTAMTSGNAITINSDFVVLDLNNFKLGGGSAGLGTNTIGIYANSHRNLTVRNGNIRGFYIGIYLTGSSTTSGGHLVENNILDGNTYYGAYVNGDSFVVRNNTVVNTGGVPASSWVTGIYGYSYALASIRDNVVSNTFNTGTGSMARGIFLNEGVADHNLVRAGAVTSGYAIGINGDVAAFCRDNTALDNTSSWGYPGCTQIGPAGSNYTNNP